MKVLLNQSVKDAALERIEWLFKEFDTLYVSVSGGKDSTVVLNLALMVAEKLGRFPVKVFFLDQEAEWRTVIEYVRTIMSDPRVDPYWMQVPFQLTNSTSGAENYLDCWAPEKEELWMRPKEAISFKENVFGETRFHGMFPAIMRTWHPDEKVAMIAGVRAEESQSRYQALTTRPKYKHVTWAKTLNPGKAPHWTFYPIYDWLYTDVWKFIHEEGVPYCEIYDRMYQYGVPVKDMRVSSLHHQTAVRALYYLQEIEQDTWDRMVARIGGVHSTRNLQIGEMFKAPKELPFMFRTWKQYRDHLLETLIAPEHQDLFRRSFEKYDPIFDRSRSPDRLTKVQIASILAYDTDLTKINDFLVDPEAREVVKWAQGKPIKPEFATWLKDEDLAKAPIVPSR